MTSGSGRTLSDVSLRTDSVVSEPPGYVPRIVTEDQVGLYADGSGFFGNDFLADIKTAVAVSKSYSKASRHVEANLSRLIPHEPVEQLSGTRPSQSHRSRRAVPESWSSGYNVDMRSDSTSQAQPSGDSMVPLVSARARATGMDVPIRRATHQEMNFSPTQSLYPVSGHRQQVQPEMRTSASLQAGGSQFTRTLYQDQFTENSTTVPSGRTQVQSTVPLLNPVGNTARPTVLSWVQLQQPGSDPIQKPSYGSSRLSTDQQMHPITSTNGYTSLPNNLYTDARQIETFSQPFSKKPVGSRSTVQTAAYRPMPTETRSTIPETSRSQFWPPIIAGPAIVGDSEPSDRLRERQNKPITTHRPNQVQAKNAEYSRALQVSQFGQVMQTQSISLHSGRQASQQPSFDPRGQRSCETCRRNGSHAPGFICYHVSLSELTIIRPSTDIQTLVVLLSFLRWRSVGARDFHRPRGRISTSLIQQGSGTVQE